MMTTTQIYYDKGYEQGKRDILATVLTTMDEVSGVIGKINPEHTLAWNKGFDDGVRTFYAALEQTLRKEVLG